MLIAFYNLAMAFFVGAADGVRNPLVGESTNGAFEPFRGGYERYFFDRPGAGMPHLKLNNKLQTLTFWTAIYGSVANWTATLLAAIWGAGTNMMPIASNGLQGTSFQEIFIAALLLSLALAMIAVCGIVLWGLRTRPNTVEAESC